MSGAMLVAIYIFVLAIFAGFEVITKVPRLLHTPLMSGANAISGISLVGAVTSAGMDAPVTATVLGTVAVAFAATNVVGGFLVTDRMLEMFKKGDAKGGREGRKEGATREGGSEAKVRRDDGG